jgi:Raf kinase inhibitor-like YbhB/YbcL family protein
MTPAIERMIGHWLRRVRAGDRYLACNDPRLTDAPETILLTSPAFNEAGPMPQLYAGSGVGENISPPLEWSNVPPGTKELVLVMQDPDAPLPRPVVHLIAMCISPDMQGVPETCLTPEANPPFQFGRGFRGCVGYAGPRPVRGHGPHRYVFQIFATRQRLDLPDKANLETVITQMADVLLARGRLTGVYERI